mmetsp:Transcript_94920/g.164800  ORF Transcript_94920/g.164800 Transcript_94920/m.164800 type:complete len:253 (+) Transcript_94920:204-962(+)
MPHGGPAMRTIPWLLQGAKVSNDTLHLVDTEGLANHHRSAAGTACEESPDLLRPRYGGRAPQRAVASEVQQTTSCGSIFGIRPALMRFCLFKGVEQVVDVPLVEDQTLAGRQSAQAHPSSWRTRVVSSNLETIQPEDFQMRFGKLLLGGCELHEVGAHQWLAIYLGINVQALKAELFIGGMLIDDEKLKPGMLRNLSTLTFALPGLRAQSRDDEAQVELTNDTHLCKTSLVEFQLRTICWPRASVRTVYCVL